MPSSRDSPPRDQAKTVLNILGTVISDITPGEAEMEEPIQIERRKCSQHDMLQREVEDLRATGRHPTYTMLAIVAFLAALTSIFATLHFSESGTLYIVQGRQELVMKQLEEMKLELAAVHEQTTRNAGSLDSLAAQIGRKP